MDFKKIKFFLESDRDDNKKRYLLSADIISFEQVNLKSRPGMQSFNLIIDEIVNSKGWDSSKINKAFKDNNEIKAVVYGKKLNKASDVYDRVFFRFKDISTPGPKKIVLYRYDLTEDQREHFESFVKVNDQYKTTISRKEFKEVLEDLRLDAANKDLKPEVKIDNVFTSGPSWNPKKYLMKASFKIVYFTINKIAKPFFSIFKKKVVK